ncbi:lyase family protein, partial [Bosea sp. (in: a-proteobacteria)]|uniref:lyase family protein n=1 Tax=Bosea sp. (in: a-proteobacteria) TaxID=1871050 RepID=UPI0033424437
MSQLLRTRPATTDAMLAVFDDAATLRHALAFEAELARAEAAEGLIGTAEAEAVAALCAGIALDPAALAGEAALAGTLAIPLVARLRRALPEAAAGSLHKGATSQDVADTILVRQIREGQALLDADLARTARALAALARRHAATPAIGRTLLQDALPIGFGLRIAQWQAGIVDAAERLRREVEQGATLQFGGAAGTRAGLAGRGAAVAARLAAAFGLPDAAPWHARRGGMAGIATALAIVIGALGKMARDV